MTAISSRRRRKELVELCPRVHRGPKLVCRARHGVHRVVKVCRASLAEARCSQTIVWYPHVNQARTHIHGAFRATRSIVPVQQQLKLHGIHRVSPNSVDRGERGRPCAPSLVGVRHTEWRHGHAMVIGGAFGRLRWRRPCAGHVAFSLPPSPVCSSFLPLGGRWRRGRRPREGWWLHATRLQLQRPIARDVRDEVSCALA